MDSSSNDVTGKEILQHLKSIESRISKLETYLDLPSAKSEEDIEEEPIIPKKKAETDEELEFRIGQFWFAKLGIFVFLVGWLIGNTLPYEGFNQIIPVVIGFVTGLVVIFAGIFFKNKFPHISGWILGSGFAIVYIAALQDALLQSCSSDHKYYSYSGYNLHCFFSFDFIRSEMGINLYHCFRFRSWLFICIN